MPSSQRGYTAEWRRIRAAFLSAHPVCVLCGQPATVVDHIVRLGVGGTHDEANLQSLCALHHNQKTNRLDGGGWRLPSIEDHEPSRQFAMRDRDMAGRAMSRVVRICGAPATGKSVLCQALDRLGLNTYSIDNERLSVLQPGQPWPERDDELRAWCQLEDALDRVSPCAVETSGRHPNDRILFAGRTVYTVLCTAADNVRLERLRQRVAEGYRLAQGEEAYVEKLFRIGPPRLTADVVWDTTAGDACGLADVLVGVERFLSG